MTETFDNSVHRERRNIGIEIFQQRKTGFRRTDFCDGSGKRTRQ